MTKGSLTGLLRLTKKQLQESAAPVFTMLLLILLLITGASLLAALYWSPWMDKYKTKSHPKTDEIVECINAVLQGALAGLIEILIPLLKVLLVFTLIMVLVNAIL